MTTTDRTGIVPSPAPILITGGAGFIGCNLADDLLAEDRPVVIFDNFSHPAAADNLRWLRERHGERAVLHAADIRDRDAVTDATNAAGAVFHLAAQPTVTHSLERPMDDFAINAGGTLNLLEALRAKNAPTPLVFASTARVYGDLGRLRLHRTNEGYVPENPAEKAIGIGEDYPLSFCSPHGCSKGAADQYVLDYATTYNLPAAVLRMSCVYGRRQMGTEDQGWMTHFALQALSGQPIALYGDGHQVRDVLHVRDAVRACRLVLARIDTLAGRVFNLGGGPKNAVSLVRLIDDIEARLARPVAFRCRPARSGDRLYFVADTRALASATGWRAEIDRQDGLDELMTWLAGEESRSCPPPHPTQTQIPA